MMGVPDRTLLSAADRGKLLGILSRLGSSFDGERAAAGLLATRLLERCGLQWDAVLVGGQAPMPPTRAGRTTRSPREPSYAPGFEPGWRSSLAICLRHVRRLADREQEFVLSMSARRKAATVRQVVWLAVLAQRLRDEGCT